MDLAAFQPPETHLLRAVTGQRRSNCSATGMGDRLRARCGVLELRESERCMRKLTMLLFCDSRGRGRDVGTCRRDCRYRTSGAVATARDNKATAKPPLMQTLRTMSNNTLFAT
ncbi:hypothetical protein IG631_18352 [Alternaria alternata]|nr:hypothetical protein IG631_18352 [Alternaria alternata]